MDIPDRAGNDPELIHVGHEEMSTFTACGAHAKFAGEDVGFCVTTSDRRPEAMGDGAEFETSPAHREDDAQ